MDRMMVRIMRMQHVLVKLVVQSEEQAGAEVYQQGQGLYVNS